METKASIRKEKLALRSQMTRLEQEAKSQMIKKKVLELPCIYQAKNILCYAGYQSEVLTSELIDSLLSLGKNVFLPRVQGEEMEFFGINSIEDLTEGYKGIPEPSETCKQIYIFTENANDVMIMPGCAFSYDGSRIGYGKGYYDRYLKKYDMVERVALCFELQLTEDIPTDEYDKKASMLVTEENIIDCSLYCNK